MSEERRAASLTYRFEGDAPISFHNPKSLDVDRGAFTVRLHEGKAVVTVNELFRSLEEADARVRSFLRDWEIQFSIEQGRHAARFVLEGGQMTDSAGNRHETIFL